MTVLFVLAMCRMSYATMGKPITSLPSLITSHQSLHYHSRTLLSSCPPPSTDTICHPYESILATLLLSPFPDHPPQSYVVSQL